MWRGAVHVVAGKVPGEACPCSGPAVPGSVAPGDPGDTGLCCFCRRPAGGQALPEVQGDGQEVCVRGLRLLQLQRPPVVSVRALLPRRSQQDRAWHRAAKCLGWEPLPQHTGLTERSPGPGLQRGQAKGVRGTSLTRRAFPASCKLLRCGQWPAEGSCFVTMREMAKPWAGPAAQEHGGPCSGTGRGPGQEHIGVQVISGGGG